MKALNNHIILSLIAFIAMNIYFVIWLLINSTVTQGQIIGHLNFYEFVGITNGALAIVSALSIYYKKLGNRLLQWGYSNFFRFIVITAISIFAFTLSCLLLFSIHFKLNNLDSINSALLGSVTNTYFIPLLFFFGLTSVLMFFISNLEQRSGSIYKLLSQSMGQSLKPRLTRRGFMFIDLNNATTLAERLRSERYANLLRDCFSMFNELVALTPFEIYQYVGDEVVVTWKESIENVDVLAIHLFTDFKAYLLEKSSAFAKAYNTQPTFKCAIHTGQVVQSEIGREVKHLVYHGDVLNTTSRLLSQCHHYQTDMLISESAVKNQKRLEQDYQLRAVNCNNLKGKQEEIKAFAIQSKTEYPVHKNNTFFLNPKVTASHYY